LGKFKNPALGSSNLRTTSKNLRTASAQIFKAKNRVLLPFLIHWDHPFKTSACLRGEGCPPLPTFADAREGGVLGLPTSAIFEIIRRQISMLENSTEILFLLWMYLIWNLMRYFCKIKYEKPMEKTFTVFSQIVSSLE
jgi:hypothetical protein